MADGSIFVPGGYTKHCLAALYSVEEDGTTTSNVDDVAPRQSRKVVAASSSSASVFVGDGVGAGVGEGVVGDGVGTDVGVVVGAGFDTSMTPIMDGGGVPSVVGDKVVGVDAVGDTVGNEDGFVVVGDEVVGIVVLG